MFKGLFSRVELPEVFNLLSIYSAQNQALTFHVFYLLAEGLGVLHESKFFTTIANLFYAVFHAV